MDTTYYELKLKINPLMEDLVSGIFFDNFDCEGIVLSEETYKNLEKVDTTRGTLRIFLKHHKTIEDLRHDIANILETNRQLFLSRGLSDTELGSWNFTLEEKESQDWSQKWKEKWDVTHVTDKITIVPDWIEYTPQKADEIIIKMEPGCAFGTGTHQTTQLCMKALEKYMKKGCHAADIGTGSGILAILASKLGASYVYGCDIDDTVIDVAIENARKNGINVHNSSIIRTDVDLNSSTKQQKDSKNQQSYITFELNTADKIQEKFDFVCANILHFVLAEIMGDLKNIMKNGALMSLSGILDEKKQMVEDAINKEHLQIIEEIHQDQWTSFVVRRN